MLPLLAVAAAATVARVMQNTLVGDVVVVAAAS